ncbi:glycoside hydrolase family 75 protein [Streptomyces cavernicola]|uniref:Glycoside hydrolase family 75 protein n=1 Tax=Streptomyces cavernicola TaxID=3043613 RepID=A0ABT6SMC7_9ACTN|nr:glycoside hydrolase family 75 protein [Streptomyces sp. B-S-A6]MDI3408999.1 glycoside hydrolase family 75 protein [Streptomyces sp. B-S-A6]
MLVPAALAPVLLTALAAPPAAADESGPTVVAEEGGPTVAAALLAKIRGCAQISKGRYRADDGAPANIPVCGGKGVVHFKADLDIDCDGRPSSVCNKRTDPYFQPTTAFQDARGRHLDSAKLPYVVVPGASKLWSHRDSKVWGGGLAAVVHRGKVQYAVVGDTGPADLIGEASYATARGLGINPHPVRGGAARDVTYIFFTGSEVKPIESAGAAQRMGAELTRRFLAGQ